MGGPSIVALDQFEPYKEKRSLIGQVWWFVISTCIKWDKSLERSFLKGKVWHSNQKKEWMLMRYNPRCLLYLYFSSFFAFTKNLLLLPDTIINKMKTVFPRLISKVELKKKINRKCTNLTIDCRKKILGLLLW